MDSLSFYRFFHISTIAISVLAANANAAIEKVDLTNFELNKAINLSQSQQITTILGMSNNERVELVNQVLLKSGKSISRFQQQYHNIPIWGLTLTLIRSANGAYERFSGFQVIGLDDLSLSLRPNLDESQIKFIAKQYMGVSHLSALKLENQQQALFIYLEDDEPKLVYEVSYYTDALGFPSRPFFIIDAHTGEVIDHWEGLAHGKKATGPGGNRNTGKYYYGKDFDHLDVDDQCRMENTNVKTINLNHATSGGSVHRFNCPENTVKEINGAYSPLNDAHYFGGVVFKLYNDWYGVKPLKTKLTLRVHYSRNYENAFWNGSSMTFGDGRNTFYPLTGLDVVSHEVSHGFTQFNSNLVYRNQSGGMNEAFSDMAGEAAEFFMRGKVDWIVGADITKSGKGIRNFPNPSKHRGSIEHIKDYRSGMDVHHSSGIFNKAFYQLAEVKGWGVRKAFDVMVLANQVFWQKNSTFEQGACDVMKAAKQKGYSVADVKTAFKVVGLGDSCKVDPPDPTGKYKSLQVGTGYCLTAAGGSITVSSCKNGNNQQWLLDDKGYLKVKSDNNSCLSVGANPKRGSRTVLSSCNSQDYQRWQFNGNVIQNAKDSSLRLTSWGARSGARVGVWTSLNNHPIQQWSWKK
ncbi:M4 family metallopeptidase [Spartinivicinus poritis]|uniref:Neutral metalloproteinase n=1 Tax=Spartinivicinus poritis TaxID=2994640 RepID=A0ABT5U6G6_9GAMM|nr:M4 family metallopeptidase [Spartinivicinus sp. A2-2]MDE1461945.1 M4 family metallopeptidase [Spartinivicinus sp. A2-2]